jgi:chromosome partitioning protein
MPVITFANTKGGAGKTTVALVLAGELARQNKKVAVLDTDPQQWVSRWSKLSAEAVNLTIVSDIDEASIEQRVKTLKKKMDYVIIDLPGGLSPLLATAIGLSDHVIVPVQGCAMDAVGGAQVLEILRQLAAKCDIRIPHSVVLTRISSIITTRALLTVKTMLAQQRVHVLDTPLIERAAFRDMFNAGGTISMLEPQRVSNLDKALENARLLADEIQRLVPAAVAPVKAPRKRAATSKKAA